ncbi:4'-phosphopantetheinyl transferase superfamily protein [Nitriliruptoraceae bacterium ZYF776]|nr:4'-phosphopantetheinyl transferase superfamily protein [Profundirhabdus halotolerans]
MTVLVTGCDVVDVARVAGVAERREGFVARVFTDREVADCTRGGVALTSSTGRARLAARFAAKEAARKALGDLRLPFHDVEVRRAPTGAPQLWVRGTPSTLACSLSHDGGVALATVVGVLEGHGPAVTSLCDPSAVTSPSDPSADRPSADPSADRG